MNKLLHSDWDDTNQQYLHHSKVILIPSKMTIKEKFDTLRFGSNIIEYQQEVVDTVH